VNEQVKADEQPMEMTREIGKCRGWASDDYAANTGVGTALLVVRHSSPIGLTSRGPGRATLRKRLLLSLAPSMQVKQVPVMLVCSLAAGGLLVAFIFMQSLAIIVVLLYLSTVLTMFALSGLLTLPYRLHLTISRTANIRSAIASSEPMNVPGAER
jgi:hypothetical protein